MNDVSEQVEEQLLTMALAERRSGGPAGLEQRVLARLAGAAVKPTPRAGRLLAAAVLLGGVAAVAAVAMTLRHDAAMAQQPTAQDPARQDPAPKPPAKVTAAELPKDVHYGWDGKVPMLDLLAHVAKDAGLPFVAAVEPTDKVLEAKFAAASPRHLLARGARAAGAHLEQFGAVLAVVPGAGPEEKVLDLKHEALPIADVLANVATMAGGNFVIDAKVTGSVAVDVERVFWRDLVAALAAAVDAEVEGGGKILRIVPKGAAPAPRVFFAYDRSPVAKVVETIGKISGERIAVDTVGAGTVTVWVKNQPAADVLAAIAATQDCDLVKADGAWRFRPKPAGKPVDPKSAPK